MIYSVPPGMFLILGALLIPFLRGRVRSTALLLLPILSALHLLAFVSVPAVTHYSLHVFGYELTPTHIDGLSLVWGYIFHIAAFVSALYSLHVKDAVQHVSGLIYMGAAIGAVFAGDLITLFVYWELTAVSSVFLIWASRTERSYRAGMRYLLVQVGSGVLLLSGILFHFRDTGSLAFDSAFRELLPTGEGLYVGLNSPGTILIFIAFGIKAAFPLLHNWLSDAYPEATPTGTVVLSAFTTKLAIYALARGFPGTEILIYIGAVMTAFPIFFAVIENDLRRVLAYSLNNQLGFMVVGIGIGTSLSLNGTAAHAFAHILYKALLFMSMGAVLMRTGTIKGSELGGLYKSMPWTAGFCIVGAASISAFPLFSGFVTKSLILTAAAQEHHTVVWLVLLFASAGVFHHSGIKIPYFAFFAHDSGTRVKEAPWNMLVAMGIAATLCILIGIVPGPLYSILPYQNVVVEHVTISILDHHIYTTTHVITQLQLLLFSALAFTVLNRWKVGGAAIYPPELPSVNLDTDWMYRRLFLRAKGQSLSPVERMHALLGRMRAAVDALVASLLSQSQNMVRHFLGPHGMLPRTWSISAKAACAVLLLTGYLVLYYVYL
ncbi:MAG: Na(+)/H(+) antiporter subunit D [Planctomycetes bacterium]|nr:Na(+)/H(+) antiporter subunit D [Planctomycetota bacterium]